jgi:hypothetical protein
MDDSFMRKERFDFLMEFKNCNECQYEQMVDYFTKDKNDVELIRKYSVYNFENDKSVALVYADLLDIFINHKSDLSKIE